MEFDKTNTFTLGKGDKDKPEHADKDTKNWPDYKGMINVEGKDYYLSAWIKENGQTKEKFFSGSITPVEARQGQITQGITGVATGTVPTDFDSEIPFAQVNPKLY